MTPRYTDRSRQLTTQACPRARYLGYEHRGVGLTATCKSVPLATGGTIHLGLEALLKGHSVDEAVGVALEAYAKLAKEATGGLTGVDLPHTQYTIAEQMALVEALVRIYAIKGLSLLQAEYEVLEVESEYEWELAPSIVMMSRLDGLLRRVADGELYVLSFKTDSGKRLDEKIEDAKIDMQGLTEPMAMERSGKWPAAFGVKMEWLVKGEWREEQRGSGLRFQDSYLVRPWRRLDAASTALAWRYFWPCPGEPHKLVKANGTTWTCQGNSSQHGLGPSYERFPIWETMPMKDWIAMLAAGQIQPDVAGDPLGEALYLPPPIIRNLAQASHLERQMRASEVKIAYATKVCAVSGGLLLDELFPQHTDHCNHSFGGPCQFKDICWAADPEAVLAMPESYGFAPRTPHHEPEALATRETT